MSANHYSEDIIHIEVVKPFEKDRTPCPPAGTPGELYNVDGKFYCVRFEKPMTDQNGGVWPKSDEDEDIKEYMFLKFYEDEIKVID